MPAIMQIGPVASYKAMSAPVWVVREDDESCWHLGLSIIFSGIFSGAPCQSPTETLEGIWEAR